MKWDLKIYKDENVRPIFLIVRKKITTLLQFQKFQMIL